MIKVRISVDEEGDQKVNIMGLHKGIYSQRFVSMGDRTARKAAVRKAITDVARDIGEAPATAV